MIQFSLGAQDKKKDIYKEFDASSFKDAGPVKIKDSSDLFQHLIGVKAGYAMANVKFSQEIEHKGINTPVNFGIYYTYYHSLWNSMPFFGIQTGLEYTESGYTILTGTVESGDRKETQERYKSVELPLISQFRIDFWKMRVLLNLGMFGAYKISSNLEGGIPSTTNKMEAGVIGGGGLAYKFHPFEIQLECNYRYAFSNLYDPQKYSKDSWVFAKDNRIIFSLGLFFNLDKRNKH